MTTNAMITSFNASELINAFLFTGNAISIPIVWTVQMKVCLDIKYSKPLKLILIDPLCKDQNMCQSIYPKCGPNEFQCKNFRCIDKKQVCDMEDNCRDGSDEYDCGSKAVHCKLDEFKCNNGDCILAVWRCDGLSSQLKSLIYIKCFDCQVIVTVATKVMNPIAPSLRAVRGSSRATPINAFSRLGFAMESMTAKICRMK